MVSKVHSVGLTGLSSFMVEVEADIAGTKFKFDMVGLPDAAVNEAKERVEAAIKNSGYAFPYGHITVNLAPADIRKEGPCFDLPIAIGELACRDEVWIPELKDSLIIGELSLDGSVRHVRGVLLIAARRRKWDSDRSAFLPVMLRKRH